MKSAKKIILLSLIFVLIASVLLSMRGFADSYSGYAEAAALKSAELQSLLRECNKKGIYPDYEASDCELVRKFDSIIQREFEQGITDNIEYYSEFINNVYSETKPRLESFINGAEKPVDVNRYKSGSAEINGNDMLVTYEDGSRKSGALMGFNFFRSDDENLFEMSKMGFSAIQYDGTNKGPGRLLTYNWETGEFSKSIYADDELNKIRTTLNICRENNILVDMGLPIHYLDFSWYKIPDLQSAGGDYGTFINFNPTSPTAKKMLKAYFELIVPVVNEYRDIIVSLTYVNEPHIELYDKSYYYPGWTAFLRNKYGTIDKLSEKYGVEYSMFGKVPMPVSNSSLYNYSQQFLDYKEYVSQVCYEFFSYCQNEIEKYTDIPCGVKMMQFFNGRLMRMSITFDYEKFSDLFGFNGTDSFAFVDDKYMNLPPKLAWYDFITSVIDRPVMDTEVHTVVDGEELVPVEYECEHISATLWMGAVHGCDLSGAWIYSDSEEASKFYRTSFLKRPYELRKYAKNSLDVQRLADEVAALQNEKRETGILYSYSDLLTNDEYPSLYNDGFELLFKAYKELTALGQRPLFITPSQLEKLDECKLLVVPRESALTDEINNKINEFIRKGGKVIYRGDFADGGAFADELEKAVKASGLTDVYLERADGEELTDVEWNSVELNGEKLISACNYAKEDVTVCVRSSGELNLKSDDIKNLNYGLREITLKPFEPVLLKVQSRYTVEELSFGESDVLEEGECSARAVIKNNYPGEIDLKGFLIAALYKDEMLQKVWLSEIKEENNENLLYINIDDIAVSNLSDGEYKLRLMVLDGYSGINPLCEAKIYSE